MNAFSATEICRALACDSLPRANTRPVASASVFRDPTGDWRYQINLETRRYCQGVGFESKADALEYVGDTLILLGIRGYETELDVDPVDGFVPDCRLASLHVTSDGSRNYST